VVDMKASGLPAPCSAVNLKAGYAVLKDIRGATQMLLIPTDRISGIESPKLLAPQSPNYWQAAWSERRLFEQRAGRSAPRDDVGLAINSAYGRSQDQLHIHIDCVRPQVKAALKAHEAEIGTRWAPLDVPLAGRRYHALRLMGEDLGARDPFKLLAEGDADARADMGRETLVVIGEVFAGGQPGFVLLSDRADLISLDEGHGEALLDHECKVLKGAG
jgi:CDP-diacylglycerol pyrophosphatase